MVPILSSINSTGKCDPVYNMLNPHYAVTLTGISVGSVDPNTDIKNNKPNTISNISLVYSVIITSPFLFSILLLYHRTMVCQVFNYKSRVLLH